jgi:glucose uptake protein GlcU
MVFWSGIPLVAAAGGAPTKTATAAVTIGALAIAATLVIGVLGNTVGSH